MLGRRPVLSGMLALLAGAGMLLVLDAIDIIPRVKIDSRSVNDRRSWS